MKGSFPIAVSFVAAIYVSACGQSPDDDRIPVVGADTAAAASDPILWEEGWAATDWERQLPPCDTEEVVAVGDDFTIFETEWFSESVRLEVTVCASDSARVRSRVRELQGTFIQTFHAEFGAKGPLCSLSLRAGAPSALRREMTERYRDVMLRMLNDSLPSTDYPSIRAYGCDRYHLDHRNVSQ